MSKVIKEGEQELTVYTEEEYKELENKYNDLNTKYGELEGKYNEFIDKGQPLPEEPTDDDKFKALFPLIYNKKEV